MATYYGTYGQKVQYLASDPSDPQIGQVWYNSTSAVLKVRGVTTVGTWAAGGSLNTARSGISAEGTQTATLAFGGDGFPSGPPTTNRFLTSTESYNGTSWTSLNSLNTGTTLGGSSGTQTAALYFAGSIAPATTFATKTESWNGTSWTTLPQTMNTGRFGLAGAGTQTSALGYGGVNYSPPGAAQNLASSESWNGSAWTNTPSLNTARRSVAGCGGSNTSALAFGGVAAPGYPGTITAATESYNGTSWTSVNSLNTARRDMGAAGIQTLAVAFGSGPTGTATELWDGTSWTTNPNSMSTSRSEIGGAGTQASALGCGGYAPGASSATEEFTGPGVGTTKTVTVS